MTIVTLFIANSPWGATFQHFWERPVGLSYDSWILERSLKGHRERCGKFEEAHSVISLPKSGIYSLRKIRWWI